MMFLLYTVHVLICLFLIAVVLLQQGKGADLSVFGGGATQTAFGARGAANVLHKMAVGSFIAFMLTTLVIGFLQAESNNSSVLGGLPDAEIAETDGDDDLDATEATPALPVGDEAMVDGAADGEVDGEAGSVELDASVAADAAVDAEAVESPAADTDSGDGDQG